MATGVIFNMLFFKCGNILPRRYAWGQRLFCIMFLYDCRVEGCVGGRNMLTKTKFKDFFQKNIAVL
jgi:hypothetical protein